MTNEYDDLSRFQEAYLDYLEGKSEECPELQGLSEKQRQEAEAFVKSITAARGVNPHASRPPIEQLLARRSQANDPIAELSQVLREHLRLTVDPRASVTADAASFAARLASTSVVQARGMRIRVVPETNSEDLEHAVIGRAEDIVRVFSAFPDSHAVLYTTTGEDCVGVVLNRGDVHKAIETPSGQTREPRLGRPIEHSATACEEWLRDTIPEFEPLNMDLLEATASRESEFDPADIVRGVVHEVSASGARARVEAKRIAWRCFGIQEQHRLIAVVQEAQRGGLSREDYESHIDDLVETAA